MSPTKIEGTNMWNLHGDEKFTTTDGEVVEGPLTGLRVNVFEDYNLMSVQGPGRLYEVRGTNFEQAVAEKK